MSKREGISRQAGGTGPGGESAPVNVPRPPDIAEDYAIWLKYLRLIERLEPHEHPLLQTARRSTRSIVRRKIGFGPQLESHSLKAFSFEACRTRRKGRRSRNDGTTKTQS